MLKKFVSKEASLEAGALKLFWQLGSVYMTSFVRLEIGGKDKNLELT